jgi:hypothetical protein
MSNWQSLSEEEQRLLAYCSLGEMQMSVHVEGAAHPRGSEVQGSVWLEGNQMPQPLSELTLSLRSPYNTLFSHLLTPSISLAPAEQKKILFSLRVPDTMPLRAYSPKSAQAGAYLLVTEVILPGGGRWAASTWLNVTIHREIRAVLGAMRAMGFKDSSWSKYHTSRPDENIETTVAFLPPESLRPHLDVASLFLSVSETEIVGNLMLTVTDSNPGSFWESLWRTRDREYLFQISRKELITPNGLPNPLGAMPYLKQLLTMALALPDDPQSWMLRPAMSPSVDPDTLLRSSLPVTSTATDNLLRSTPPPEEN